jgi:hypothetical protein
MPRVPPALWLLGLAVAVSWLTRPAAPRPARALAHATRHVPAAPAAASPVAAAR